MFIFRFIFVIIFLVISSKLYDIWLKEAVINEFSKSTKHVVITGASMGIGEQLAYEYCKLKAKVLIIARTEEKMKRVCSKCTSKCDYLVADFENTDDGYYKTLMSNVVAKMDGKIDTLVLNHVIVTGAVSVQMLLLLYITFNVKIIIIITSIKKKHGRM